MNVGVTVSISDCEYHCGVCECECLCGCVSEHLGVRPCVSVGMSISEHDSDSVSIFHTWQHF